ncbi:multicopper oxidase [Aplosporella prunicola CBS 121167]|uniref:laccase n=1 Tax=Aplosporella prunicola CBS 121167 TaxID=1176127 RepID=A0A6A6B401_9PEZI|nr:multicopper oxidase [Aplosporella prunicola CBS 121167]KAF2137677.1 multicopper oxidase [Aplosporella prunicola CBS 121167]
MVKRQAATTTSRVADPACTNGPLSRSCWAPGFSIATDFDAKWPDTGKTVTASLEITNTTCNPDGHGDRVCLLFNNQYPGPTIVANWGDTISVTVKNSMQSNGTGVHWHGVRQLNTNGYDGVGGITECPLAPGDTKTYTFKATQFGTSWFHSHFSTQYGDGAVGQLIINGPASANYDYDLGAYPITDWYYNTAFQIEDAFNAALQRGGPGPGGDNILVNGTAKSSSGGKYSSVQMTKGKKYRLRLINTSVDNNIYVSLDNHPFNVINNDFVSVVPFTTNWLLMAVGQRYDVIITANQTVGNYWFRAEVATGCASANNGYGRGIFSYSGAPSGDPTSTGGSQPGDCNEPLPTPFAPNNVPSDTFLDQVKSLDVDLTVANVTTNNKNVVFWGVNLTAIDIAWEQPTLQLVADGKSDFPQTYNLIEIPQQGIWTYWIIQEVQGGKANIPHPIHLHGHDFLVLAKSGGQFDVNSSPSTFRWTNPTRRDVILLPAGGWVAIAFITDNPGAWLMHCHISWHISEGLGVQFLESKSSISLPGDFQSTCNKWDDYTKSSSNVWPKQDSGL